MKLMPRLRYLLISILLLSLAGCASLGEPRGNADGDDVSAAYREAGFEVGHIIRRFKEGDLLIKRADGSAWILVPKKHCSWCWMHVQKKVYVEFGHPTTTLISLDGDAAECWTREQVRSY